VAHRIGIPLRLITADRRFHKISGTASLEDNWLTVKVLVKFHRV